ncbi:hypothetical protein HD554DRAFT_406232 [Boletus coccyginus]|nr:hypothetical protein HD554DRAFT_406232 [Boletus coccyginus]
MLLRCLIVSFFRTAEPLPLTDRLPHSSSDISRSNCLVPILPGQTALSDPALLWAGKPCGLSPISLHTTFSTLPTDVFFLPCRDSDRHARNEIYTGTEGGCKSCLIQL